MLPEVEKRAERRGRAIVSTQRTTAFETIPDPDLIETLGKRVANVERYAETPVGGVGVGPAVDQPWRTDLKTDAAGNDLAFLELRFKRGPASSKRDSPPAMARSAPRSTSELPASTGTRSRRGAGDEPGHAPGPDGAAPLQPPRAATRK